MNRYKVNKIFKLYENYGNKTVNQIEHMAQTAKLAEKDGFNDEIILACLFHDIGHLLAFEDKNLQTNGFGVIDYEKCGADFLRSLNFSEKIPSLIENHIKSRQYLAFKDPNYIKKLSSESRETLIQQGGIMTYQEAKDFERHPYFNLSIQIRLYDDQVKIENYTKKSLDYYKKMCYEYLYRTN
jgi:2-amino-1-hydroxyethylphosphonate dioxygenase (glycine-forming)